MSKSRRMSAGFTIVELVIVIILLGILAALALPRFLDADEDARINSAKQTMGSFLEAVNLAHGKWLADGGRATSLTFDGVTVPFDNNGWPKTQVSNTAECINVWNGVFQAPEDNVPFVINTPQPAWSTLGFATGCLYVYQYGQAFSAGNPLPFFVYLSTPTGATILPFNM